MPGPRPPGDRRAASWPAAALAALLWTSAGPVFAAPPQGPDQTPDPTPDETGDETGDETPPPVDDPATPPEVEPVPELDPPAEPAPAAPPTSEAPTEYETSTPEPAPPEPVPDASTPGTRAWSPGSGQVEPPPPPQPPTPVPGSGTREGPEPDGKGRNKRQRKQRNWGFDRPMIWPRFGLGASFGSFAHNIAFGLGATYFFRIGIGLGLDFDNSITIYRAQAKLDFPGIDEELPTNVARLTPHLQWIVLPGRGFTPYLRGGVGPTIYNNGHGTLGHWTSAAGVMVRVGGRFFVDLGVSVGAQFPDDRYREVWTYQDQEPLCGLSDDICSLTVSPRIGLSFGFGIPAGRGR